MQATLVSSTLPMAAMTGGVTLALPAADAESASERLRFSKPVEIIACVVTVSANEATGAQRQATIDDLELRIEGTDIRPTRDLSDDGDGSTFVDARSMTLPLRYLGTKMPGAPDVNVQVRWKSPNHNALFVDCLVSVVLLFNFTEAN